MIILSMNILANFKSEVVSNKVQPLFSSHISFAIFELINFMMSSTFTNMFCFFYERCSIIDILCIILYAVGPGPDLPEDSKECVLYG